MLLRLNIMLEKGFITEVERLKTLDVMRSIGYRQICEFIDGKYNFFILKEKILSANRNLAKKQKLWLRKYKDAFWLDAYNYKISDMIVYLLKSNITEQNIVTK